MVPVATTLCDAGPCESDFQVDMRGAVVGVRVGARVVDAEDDAYDSDYTNEEDDTRSNTWAANVVDDDTLSAFGL